MTAKQQLVCEIKKLKWGESRRMKKTVKVYLRKLIDWHYENGARIDDYANVPYLIDYVYNGGRSGVYVSEHDINFYKVKDISEDDCKHILEALKEEEEDFRFGEFERQVVSFGMYCPKLS